MKRAQVVANSTSKHITKLQKEVIILFTDIEQSTEYWDTFGDVEGRLMVDRHNRLLFPIIKSFRGKIIKTIGDAIMASFQKAQNAVNAAIAIQQILEKERADDELFKLKVRIGIHSGDAIVEKGDIFGDVVNVAARVEREAAGGEILISGNTFGKLDEHDFTLIKKGRFKLKGKETSLVLYQCNWQEHQNLTDNLKLTSYLPVIARQKVQLLIYFLSSIGFLYFLYLKYIRYLFADTESVALLFLNPKNLIYEHPLISTICALSILTIIILLLKLKTIPHFILPLLQGSFGFSMAFVVFYFLANILPVNIEWKWKEIIQQSDHLFVEVLEENSFIYGAPSLTDTTKSPIGKGSLLLLSGVAKHDDLLWNKVLVQDKKWGWILRVKPAEMGIPEKRLTIANKFYFRYRDLYAFIFGFIIFFWSFFKFRVLPV